jgi:MoaA/NifB/PqqE/SkfB family radical SAM enzyme
MNQYATLESIRELHVEISTLCNAACPMCARNDHGYSNGFKSGQWSNNDHELVFGRELPNLSKVYFCGSHGDPLTHHNFIPILTHCKNRNIQVDIFTNGSLRTQSWWKDLVKILSDEDRIIFGIDGLETNHLYRQNTDIEKVLDRLSICCQAKVKTQWDFIPFEHNEHELEKCKDLAKKMGVDSFRLRKTARFKQNEHSVRNPKTGEITHILKPPTNVNLRHPDFDQLQYLSKTQLPTVYNINCIYKNNFRLYVNSKLQVLPCSYIGSDLESNRPVRADQLLIPAEELSLNHNTWHEILNSEFYINDLVESFTSVNATNRCIRTCGVVNRILNQNQILKI